MLITALATALGSLNTAAQTPARTATARKTESLLVAEIKAADPATLPDCLSAIINSGSLKALKAVPATITLPAPRYNGPVCVNAARVLEQPAAFQKEAIKRGFALSGQQRLAMVDTMLETKTLTKDQRSLIETGLDSYFVTHLITKIVDTPLDEAIAGDVAALLKKAAKTEKDTLEKDARAFAALHDPRQGHAAFTRFVTTFALMGIKLPAAKDCVNPTVGAFMAAVGGRGAKKTLETEVGTLEAFLAAGMPTPAAAKPIESAIRSYYPQRRSLFR